MSAFGQCIELLDDMNQFSETVQGLGKAHHKIGINGGHLRVSNLKLLLSLDLSQQRAKQLFTLNCMLI